MHTLLPISSRFRGYPLGNGILRFKRAGFIGTATTAMMQRLILRHSDVLGVLPAETNGGRNACAEPACCIFFDFQLAGRGRPGRSCKCNDKGRRHHPAW
ncbi:hypothetical protein BRAS3843_2760007 [Bradyrhizobium sp. STM 3843]|nr:hypothetical protein BRAS3843_2760007 [Bradyrhizobium sp. STM 3843]